MIENFPDELYQLQSVYEKDAKLHANIMLELEGEKCSKIISMYLKDNMQNQKTSELYTDDKKTKYSSSPNDNLKSAQNFYEKLYMKR